MYIKFKASKILFSLTDMVNFVTGGFSILGK